MAVNPVKCFLTSARRHSQDPLGRYLVRASLNCLFFIIDCGLQIHCPGIILRGVIQSFDYILTFFDRYIVSVKIDSVPIVHLRNFCDGSS